MGDPILGANLHIWQFSNNRVKKRIETAKVDKDQLKAKVELL